ncbi:hypothetical protein LMG1861_04982 [Achromobacter piechaudii]|uniref:Uncharacterized protein n=1 Tax=Achromobacter piechaudii TaxID=72556 RepID=A0A6S7EN91_9BURK|nr:hypothetical protein LMG1861_04982 [Achromobacter piechaudii]
MLQPSATSSLSYKEASQTSIHIAPNQGAAESRYRSPSPPDQGVGHHVGGHHADRQLKNNTLATS